MMELARKKSAKKRGTHRIFKQYVVSPVAGRQSNMYLVSILRRYPKVTVLDRLDNSTALVEMSDVEREQISREHPELLIEPNLLYKLVG